jgi:hypothetical protein
MISYNVHQAERAFARAARRQGINVERAFVHEFVEEAACLLDASVPEPLHRRVDERDVARVALLLATRAHRETIRESLDELVESLAR